MKRRNMNLHSIIDVNKWQVLQDSLSRVTKMAIITTDYKGVPITEHSGCNTFCQMVREDKELFPNCMRCDSRGGFEATRLNTPYIYLCHYNIVDAAIPILIDDKYIGAFMVGQVILSSADNNDLERICNPLSSVSAKEKEDRMQVYYNQLPRMSYESIKSIVDMLFELCTYIVRRAEEMDLIVQSYENLLENALQKQGEKALDLSGYSVQVMENVKRKLSDTINNIHMSSQLGSSNYCSNEILEPAFAYIHNNKNKNPPLMIVAELCHVSPSYFSRLFVKEMGENYSVFLSRLKTDWAKQLLETTKMSVGQISLELGFSEAGYFIKTFKKHAGVTPALYRKYLHVDGKD